MKNIFLAASLYVITALSFAQSPQQKEEMMASMMEMRKLVAASTPSREYLSCAMLSANLNMTDMYGLFVRKAAEFTENGDALRLALTYMTGFTDSEMMHLKEGLTSEETGEALAILYQTKCMKYIFPK